MAAPLVVGAIGLAGRFTAKSASRVAVNSVRSRVGGEVVKQSAKKGGNRLAKRVIDDFEILDISNPKNVTGSLIEVVGSNGSNITNAINNLTRSILATGGFDVPADFFVNQAVPVNAVDDLVSTNIDIANAQFENTRNLSEFLGSLIGTLQMQIHTMDRLINKIDEITKVGDTITVSPTPINLTNQVNPTPINVNNNVNPTPVTVKNQVNPASVNVNNQVNASLQVDKPLDINLPGDYVKSVIDTNIKQNELMDSQIEDLNFKKTAKKLKDLNGNDIATASPREMEFIKNGAKAQVDSDENSFDYDPDDFSDDDLKSFVNLFSPESRLELQKKLLQGLI